MTDGALGADRIGNSPAIIHDAADTVLRLRSISKELLGEELSVREQALRKSVEIERKSGAALETSAVEFQRESHALATRVSMGREKLEQERATALDALTKARDTAIAEFDAQTKKLSERARENVEEGSWLADTLVESVQRKATQELAHATKVAAEAIEELRRLEQLGPTRRLSRRSESSLPPESDDPAAALSQLRRDLSVATEAAERLRRAMASTWMSWVPACSFAAGVVLVTFGVSAFVSDELVRRVIVWGSMASITSFVSCACLRFLLRGKCRPLAAMRDASFDSLERTASRLTQVSKELYRARIEGARIQRDSDSVDNRARAESDERLLAARKSIFLELKEKLVRDFYSETDRWDQRAARLEEEGRRLTAELNALRSAREQEIKSRTQSELRLVRDEHEVLRNRIRSKWRDETLRFTERCQSASTAMVEMLHPWIDDRSIDSDHSRASPEVLPIGRIKVSARSKECASHDSIQNEGEFPDSWSFPACLDLRHRGSLLVEHDASNRGEAVALVNNTMLRLLAASPAGKVRFTIFDPVALGEQFASFMHLADVEPLIVNDRIWTEAKHIEQKLADITEHMEMVIQKYLRNQFATIQEYNAQAGEVAEPYRFLVVADFPAGFTDSALARLKGIIASGQRCGVFVLMMTDAKRSAPAAPLLAELERVACTMRAGPSGWSPTEFGLNDGEFIPEAPPTATRLSHVMSRLAEKVRDSSNVKVPFSAVSPMDNQIWSRSSAQELTVELGRAGARRLQQLQFGRAMAQHALIAGRTGSGKSTLFHVMITNLALWYSPDELEFYLIDFKKGVEFKAYATCGLPHARVIAVESEREFGLSVLKRLDAELSDRGQLFREAGAQDLAAFRRARPDVRMPRVLLAVDEFQEFFVEDDRLAQDSALLLDRLVRQGRAFGMHLVLGSQTLGGAFSIARSTIGQMAVRIALQSSEQDSYLIMSEENTAPRLLTRPGEAIYNDQSGAVEGNSPFQIVWLGEEEREVQLRRIAGKRAAGDSSPRNCIVFEGNVPASIEAHETRWKFESSPAKPIAEPSMWLGDAVSIKEPTCARMRRRGGGNLLIVGADDQAAGVLQSIGALSLLKQHPNTTIQVLDASPLGDEYVSPFRTIADGSLPTEYFGFSESPEVVLGRAAKECEARENDPQRVRAPYYVFINGIHRFRELRKSDEFDFTVDPAKADKPTDVLARLIREGPTLGIHFVVWCDGVNNLDRFMNRQLLREFALRVVYQMSPSDSTHVIDSPAAQYLGRNRALLYDDETASAEKFRPFARPTEDRMRWMVRDLAGRY